MVQTECALDLVEQFLGLWSGSSLMRMAQKYLVYNSFRINCTWNIVNLVLKREILLI